MTEDRAPHGGGVPDGGGVLGDDRPADDPTFAGLVAARGGDDRPGLSFEDRSWTWREVVAEARLRAGLVRDLSAPGPEPWHVGLFLENGPDHLFWLLGAALAGVPVVELNPTRRGAELARDMSHTDCGAVVTETARAELLDGLTDVPVLVVDTAGHAERLARAVPLEGAPGDDPATVFCLIFTSGTTSAPKAVLCGQGRLGRIARQQAARRNLGRDDAFYVAMPMFHSNALMAGIAPAVATGGRLVLRRRFSASGFLPDVRRYGVTFFNYVGKPLSYILATPPRPDDADNPLRIAFGNEAAQRDIDAFAERFGCTVIDSYGSSEGEIRIGRVPGTPPGSLGVAEDGVIVADPETLRECPRAEFDEHGRLANADEAVGEIVDTRGAARFEGYYRNPEATAKRVRNGWVWSGDLAYRDAAGYWYFAGRGDDWLRVDGENFAAAPLERLLARYDGFADVAVYAVPDERVGDQVMAAVTLAPGRRFDPSGFAAFLAGQPDLGTKQAPRYVRVLAELPRTPTNKVLKRVLRDAAWNTGDPVYVRRSGGFVRLAASPAASPEGN
ncbi:AMP-binding protein [Actinomadura sp. WMMB 499]|uniref:AMP-binding protein n=1 Tax=Actinomadura sp. WMMB 499 TaxID=1219491 RepID=UPI001243D6ED|nr:AMP-binding protein [Actinomadura sp. WMMB 499]QFG24470.1 AMP-binding protein [Actinomadura sp. WMMB 499]